MSHATNELTPLPSLEAFQALLQPATAEPWVAVWFTADWCGPCKRIPVNRLLAAVPSLKWYLANADNNDDVLDYCGVTTIPSFMVIKKGVPGPVFQSSDYVSIEDFLKKQCYGSV